MSLILGFRFHVAFRFGSLTRRFSFYCCDFHWCLSFVHAFAIWIQITNDDNIANSNAICSSFMNVTWNQVSGVCLTHISASDNYDDWICQWFGFCFRKHLQYLCIKKVSGIAKGPSLAKYTVSFCQQTIIRRPFTKTFKCIESSQFLISRALN